MKYYPALEANAKTCASFQRLTRIMGQSKMDAMLHFGGFALSGNDKWSFLKNTDYWLQRAKNVDILHMVKHMSLTIF